MKRKMNKLSLACYNNCWKVNVVIWDVIEDISIDQIFITTVVIFPICVIAYFVSLAQFSFIKNFSLNMFKSPIFRWQVWNWIFSMSDSRMESVWINFLEPFGEHFVTNPWRSISFQQVDFIPSFNQMRSSMSSKCTTKTMTNNTVCIK